MLPILCPENILPFILLFRKIGCRIDDILIICNMNGDVKFITSPSVYLRFLLCLLLPVLILFHDHTHCYASKCKYGKDKIKSIFPADNASPVFTAVPFCPFDFHHLSEALALDPLCGLR